jgi:DNA-binding beta-propeller fold protein YncE
VFRTTAVARTTDGPHHASTILLRARRIPSIPPTMHPLLPLLALTLAASPDTAGPAQSAAGVLVVANQGDATVHLVDAASGRTLAVLPAAPAPHEVAVSHDGRWAVASNYGDRANVGHTLTVIDLASRSVARTIDLAPHTRPHGIAFLPGDTLLAVTSETSRAVVLVAFPGGEVRGVVPTGEQGTHILAIEPGGRKVWTANVGSGTATELNLETRRPVRTITVGPGAEGIALSPDGARLWAASMGRDSTYLFDTATGARLAALSTPGHAYRVALSPDGRRALIPAPELDLVRVVDTATLRETAIRVEGTPGGAVFSADGRTAYVPLIGSGRIAVVDLERLAVTRTLPAGAAPDGLAISPSVSR